MGRSKELPEQGNPQHSPKDQVTIPQLLAIRFWWEGNSKAEILRRLEAEGFKVGPDVMYADDGWFHQPKFVRALEKAGHAARVAALSGLRGRMREVLGELLDGFFAAAKKNDRPGMIAFSSELRKWEKETTVRYNSLALFFDKGAQGTGEGGTDAEDIDELEEIEEATIQSRVRLERLQPLPPAE